VLQAAVACGRTRTDQRLRDAAQSWPPPRAPSRPWAATADRAGTVGIQSGSPCAKKRPPSRNGSADGRSAEPYRIQSPPAVRIAISCHPEEIPGGGGAGGDAERARTHAGGMASASGYLNYRRGAYPHDSGPFSDGRQVLMATRTAADGTQKELSYRKRLIEIANAINSAGSIQDILVDIKDKMLDLVDSERVTIFALDTKNQELFSLVKAGTEVKEIRVPKTFGSIAGFTALSRKTANIKNAYDPAELTRLHPNLKFDSRWDKAGNFRTGQVLATPILFEKYLLGVLQLINKRNGGSFSPKDEEAAEELSKILGIAFYNQHRAARSNKPSKYGLLVDKGLVSEKDLENAIGNARINQFDVSLPLHLDVREGEILRAAIECVNTPFADLAGRTIPDVKERLTADFLKKNMCAPIEKKEGTLPSPSRTYDLTKLDAIRP
jgi:hypothetical protein